MREQISGAITIEGTAAEFWHGFRVQQILGGTVEGLQLFEEGATSLTGQGRKNLRHVVDVLKRCTQQAKGYQIVIRGYASRTGNAKQNERVTTARTESVRAALIESQATSDKQIFCFPEGESYANQTVTASADRRVTIELRRQGGAETPTDDNPRRTGKRRS